MMLSFTQHAMKTQLLKEYLTPAQRKKYSGYAMTPEAREATDHFFGPGMDHKMESLPETVEKSEIHKKVEAHLGKEITPEQYKSGVHMDKYGRSAKIGKSIKDDALRAEFASDNTRAGAKSSTGHQYSTIVRGTEVAGQTNPAKTDVHPEGHSWAEESCKNLEDGINKHYLKDEIKHGTVVVRVHDSSHKEIYRGTLQPHLNADNKRVYALNSEYGIKHPAYTAHAKDVAERLSAPPAKTVNSSNITYKIHPEVYDDRQNRGDGTTAPIMHPAAPDSHIQHAIDSNDNSAMAAALSSRNIQPHHIDAMLDHKMPWNIKLLAVKHPSAASETLHKALSDQNDNIRSSAIENPNITTDHISKAMQDSSKYVVAKAVAHPKATIHHLDQVLNDDDDMDVKAAVFKNPHVLPRHIDKGLADRDSYVAAAAASHKKISSAQLHKALDHKSNHVQANAIENENARPEHIDRALDMPNEHARDIAISHHNLSSGNIDKILDSNHPHHARNTYHLITGDYSEQYKKKMDSSHIHKLLDSKSKEWRVSDSKIEVLRNHTKVGPDHIDKALNDDEVEVRKVAAEHSKASSDNIHKALRDKNTSVARAAVLNPNATKEHIAIGKAHKNEYVQFAAASAERNLKLKARRMAYAAKKKATASVPDTTIPSP